jgi:hypothetical protein
MSCTNAIFSSSENCFQVFQTNLLPEKALIDGFDKLIQVVFPNNNNSDRRALMWRFHHNRQTQQILQRIEYAGFIRLIPGPG